MRNKASRRRGSHIVTMTSVILLSVLLPSTAAMAATRTYHVKVGKFLHGAPAESMRFFPETIRIHQGDILHFTSDGFHTATLLPLGAGPIEWLDRHAGPGDPYASLQRDRDDGPRAYVFSTAVALPTDPSCGGSGQSPCSFDGSSLLNSGVPLSGPLDMAVSVDVAPGRTFYVVCLIHGAMMHMKVNVVANSKPRSSPNRIKDANTAALAQDHDTALALVAKFDARRTWHWHNGTKVWDAWAGVDSSHIAVYGMFPNKLKIARGDKVQWHFDELTFEDHTVSFPAKTAYQVAGNSFVPVCESASGADNPPQLPGPPFCNNPADLEIQLDNRFVTKIGDGSFARTDYQNSGVRGTNSHFGDRNYTLKFTKRSGAEPFQYICLIHPFMRGRVRVG
jgi:plastocyanin